MQAEAGHIVRRYVKVAPPIVHAGVGDALRQAFRMESGHGSPRRFEELLELLN